MAMARLAHQLDHMFVSDVELMNISSYIHWCHITYERTLYLSVPTNI
jgi:hypothetical protein